MSRQKFESVNCPKCSKEQQVEVWESINVTIDPSLRVRLLKGNINFFKCLNCDCETNIQTPLLYHDMNRDYAVQYYPFDFLDNDEFIKDIMEKEIKFSEILESEPINIPEYLLKPHIVFDLNEMCRYILYKEKMFGLIC